MPPSTPLNSSINIFTNQPNLTKNAKFGGIHRVKIGELLDKITLGSSNLFVKFV